VRIVKLLGEHQAAAAMAIHVVAPSSPGK